MKKLIITICTLLIISYASYAQATTRYIRLDGGTGTQCTGLSNVAYDGSGTGEACALNHPNWVLPPAGGANDTSKGLANGDTAIIASGSYKIGCQNTSNCRDSTVNLVSSTCYTGAPHLCRMSAVPSNATVIGCSSGGCATEGEWPELWGQGRVSWIFDIRNTTNVTLSDIEVTDHASCGTGNINGYSCGSRDAAELTTNIGIFWGSSTNALLKNMNIHGMRHAGIYGGLINGVTLDNVTIAYNSYVGIDFDSCGGGACGNTGTIKFMNGTTIQYSGCVEDGNNPGTIVTGGCYGPSQGGYGDAIGTASSNDTTGDWIFEDVDISFNVQDGIDLLHVAAGISISIKRSRFEGNAGNAIKIPNNAYLEDNIIIANCGYFTGQTFTQEPNFVDCRAGGQPIVITWRSSNSEIPKIYANTVLTNGDNLFVTSGCSGGDMYLKNNIFHGGNHFGGGDQSSFSFTYCSVNIVEDYNICYDFKNSGNCPGANSVDDTNPLFTGTILMGPTFYTDDDFIDQLTLQSGSPARTVSDVGLTGLDDFDKNKFDRGAAEHDAGGFEFGTTPGVPGTCGDNVKDVGEVCDGTDLDDETCVSRGFDSGDLACDGDCLGFDESACVTDLCGNGDIDPGEECDGVNLGGGTCASEGFSECSGTLACLGSCLYNTSGCVAIACQDNCVDVGEECDDGNATEGDGCSSICEIETPGIELFLTYTEVDVPGHLEVATHKVTATGITHNADNNIYFDFGASFFGDFVQRLEVTIDSCSDNGAGEDGGMGLWAMSAALYPNLKAQEDASDGLDLSLGCLSSAARHTWKLVGDGALLDSFEDSAPTLIRYFEIERNGTALTAKIYDNNQFSNLLATLSGTVATTTYRYLYAATSYNSSTSGTSFSGSVEMLDLDAGGGNPPETPATSSITITGNNLSISCP